jgi:predicted metalloprotease
MFRRRTIALLGAATLSLAACGGSIDVTTERADPIGNVDGPQAIPPAPTDESGGSEPTTDDLVTDEPGAPPGAVVVPPTIGERNPDAIDFGPNKPPHDYDDFLLAVAADLELWWSVQYPAIYGQPFVPLEGGIYAAYPSRPDDIPGCGAPRTTYDDVAQFVAFYCGAGDFMVYDDGDDGLLVELAVEYGAATIGTVLAHEFAHAIQFRFGGLERALPTVVTEQQADCFAGAWAARAANGGSPTIQFSDADVRAGLIAMTKVSDPVGIDQFAMGSHGSAFDRVGAFQVGFNDGPARCAELLDTPLPLMPNQFLGAADVASGGNAPYGYGDAELVGFLPEDLNRYWNEELAAEIPGLDRLAIAVAQEVDDIDCSDLRGDFDSGTALCASTNQVYVNEPAALDLYETIGDFAVGYLLASAWSEAVQIALDSELTGEARALLSDCLTGGWVKTITPIEFALPEPRLPSRDVRISPGDLDESIQTVLAIADLGVDDDVVGNAFEKIDAFRTGVISGTDACLAQL